MTPETFESSDIVVLTTDHDDCDYQMIQDKSKLIIDTLSLSFNDLINSFKYSFKGPLPIIKSFTLIFLLI